MSKRRQLRGFDLKQIEGLSSLIGVDEAGRGALAGPVVAGAVLLTREFLDSRWADTNARRINDSKLEGIYPPGAFEHKIEPDLFSAPEELATFQPTVSSRVLIDGLPLRNFPYPHTGVVSGDGRSLCIAMASIIAKVTRDRLMNELDQKFPGYGFAAHKGYGTEEHREAVLRLGRTPQHREMFLRKLMASRVDPTQMDFLGE